MEIIVSIYLSHWVLRSFRLQQQLTNEKCIRKKERGNGRNILTTPTKVPDRICFLNYTYISYSFAYLHVMLHQLLAAADGIDHIGADQLPGCLALECRNGIIEADIEWIPGCLLSRLWRRLILPAFLGGFRFMQFFNRHLRLLIGCVRLMKASRCPHPRRRPCSSCRIQPV